MDHYSSISQEAEAEDKAENLSFSWATFTYTNKINTKKES